MRLCPSDCLKKGNSLNDGHVLPESGGDTAGVLRDLVHDVGLVHDVKLLVQNQVLEVVGEGLGSQVDMPHTGLDQLPFQIGSQVGQQEPAVHHHAAHFLGVLPAVLERAQGLGWVVSLCLRHTSAIGKCRNEPVGT